jgi:hypothetical protein
MRLTVSPSLTHALFYGQVVMIFEGWDDTHLLLAYKYKFFSTPTQILDDIFALLHLKSSPNACIWRFLLLKVHLWSFPFGPFHLLNEGIWEGCVCSLG